MEGLKTELFGIAIILAGIAVSTNNALGWAFGGLGLLIAAAGYFTKEK